MESTTSIFGQLVQELISLSVSTVKWYSMDRHIRVKEHLGQHGFRWLKYTSMMFKLKSPTLIKIKLCKTKLCKKKWDGRRIIFGTWTLFLFSIPHYFPVEKKYTNNIFLLQYWCSNSYLIFNFKISNTKKKK